MRSKKVAGLQLYICVRRVCDRIMYFEVILRSTKYSEYVCTVYSEYICVCTSKGDLRFAVHV